MRRPSTPGQVSSASLLTSEYIAIGEQKRLGEIIPLRRRRFRIARKSKPQRSHTPPAKPNSTAEHRRRANPRSRWTRLKPYENRRSVEETDPRSSSPPAARPEAGERGPQAAAAAAPLGSFLSREVKGPLSLDSDKKVPGGECVSSICIISL